MHLTKSQFLTFLESPLHLWLFVHGSSLPQPASAFDQLMQQQGYRVEKLAKEFLQRKVTAQYPPGSTIEFEVVLSDSHFESRIDALVHDTTHQTYDLYEIKSSTSIHLKHLYDVTFQHLIAKAQLPVHKTYLLHVNNEYQRKGELDLDQLFVVEDMSEQIAKKTDEVYEKRAAAWDTLNLEHEPSDEHCLKPKDCQYPDHCFPGLPEYTIYDLGKASRKQLQALEESGIKLVKDIPDTMITNAKQRLQIQSARLGQPIIDYDGIRHELNKLEFPLYFLDYETYGEALPLFDGYKPHQVAVTQFSLHVARHPDSTDFEHYEYLATKASDPAAEVAKSLCEVIGKTGTILVWNKSFECGRNEELAVLCSDFAEQLRGINARTYDLMEIFSLGLYVNYRFHGSASIKKVLPVLCPELSYKELEIGEGTKAMLAWHEMVYGNLSEAEKDKIKYDLLTYCKLDTWAMVEIWRRLKILLASN